MSNPNSRRALRFVPTAALKKKLDSHKPWRSRMGDGPGVGPFTTVWERHCDHQVLRNRMYRGFGDLPAPTAAEFAS